MCFTWEKGIMVDGKKKHKKHALALAPTTITFIPVKLVTSSNSTLCMMVPGYNCKFATDCTGTLSGIPAQGATREQAETKREDERRREKTREDERRREKKREGRRTLVVRCDNRVVLVLTGVDYQCPV